MKDSIQRPPTWFYILTVILLVWNAMGLFAFFGQVAMSAEQLEALSDVEQTLYEDVPFWATIAFALAVFGGTLGCVGLILRRTWAKWMFIISLIGIVIQMAYNVFIYLGPAMDLYGPGAIFMPIMVLVIGIFLIWFANYSIRKGWLR